MKKWLKFYNEDYNDNLTAEDIKGWATCDYVKPECGKHIYDYLSYHKFYRDLDIIPGAVEVTKELSKYYDIFVVTDAMFTRMSFKSKFDWLQEFFPHIPASNIVFCGNKGVIGTDYLVDDGVHNLRAFKQHGIVFDAPWNRKETDFDRVKNFDEVRTLFMSKLEGDINV